MPILYSAIAKETQVLVESATCDGNFTEVTTEVLSKISSHEERLTYFSGGYHFHYVADNRLVYFCITGVAFPRSKAFSFLNEIQKKFQSMFQNVLLVTIPYAALKHASDCGFARVMESEIKRYNDSCTSLPKVKADLKELKNIMVQNVNLLASRGEQLETLVDRADGLVGSAHVYRSTSVRVQRKYWWQNVKMYIVLFVVSIFAAYFIGAMVCGGLTWTKCVG